MHWLYSFAAWSFVLSVAWSIWATIRDTVRTGQRLQQIPCANCQFFTDSSYLKCPVHPSTALTEEAINCPDYSLNMPKYYAASMNCTGHSS